MRHIDGYDPQDFNEKQELGEGTYIEFLYDETKLYLSTPRLERNQDGGVCICGLENMRKLREFMNDLDIEEYD